MIKRLALVIAGAVVAVLGLGAAQAFGFSPFQFLEEDRKRPALLESIQDASRFTAATANFEVVISDEDDAVGAPAFLKLPNFIDGRSTLFVAAGTVDAYVDLAGLTEGDVTLSADGTSATIRLPEPELEEPNLDLERTLVTTERGLLSRVSDAINAPEQEQFYELAEADMAAAAEESDLRERAAENTQSMLTGLCKSLGVDVTFLD